jgi:hypothetical protein
VYALFARPCLPVIHGLTIRSPPARSAEPSSCMGKRAAPRRQFSDAREECAPEGVQTVEVGNYLHRTSCGWLSILMGIAVVTIGA